jgi:hypothetical protein
MTTDLILCIVAAFAAVTIPQIYAFVAPKRKQEIKINFSKIIVITIVMYLIISYFSNI